MNTFHEILRFKGDFHISRPTQCGAVLWSVCKQRSQFRFEGRLFISDQIAANCRNSLKPILLPPNNPGSWSRQIHCNSFCKTYSTSKFTPTKMTKKPWDNILLNITIAAYCIGQSCKWQQWVIKSVCSSKVGRFPWIIPISGPHPDMQSKWIWPLFIRKGILRQPSKVGSFLWIYLDPVHTRNPTESQLFPPWHFWEKGILSYNMISGPCLDMQSRYITDLILQWQFEEEFLLNANLSTFKLHYPLLHQLIFGSGICGPW